MLEPFGRSLVTPTDGQSWFWFVAVLAGIGVSYGVGAGWSTTILALIAATAIYSVDGRLFVPIAIGCSGVCTLLCKKRALRRDGWERALREGIVIGSGFLLYETGRAIVEGDRRTALRHAGSVLSVERRSGLGFESSLQRLALEHERIMVFFNGVYSWGFLSFVVAVLFWLYATDDDAYRLMRTGLGISALLALVTMALYPVAPPRLTPASGLLDSHQLFGHGHGFVNVYAAMPSLHVGWTLLAGYALSRSLRSRFAQIVSFLPAFIMMATVIVTGNHYWLDGVVGSLYAVVPVLVMARVGSQDRWSLVTRRPLNWPIPMARLNGVSGWAICSFVGLGVLLAYLLVRQVIDPGFTHYWGYTVLQIALTVAVLVAVELTCVAQGGLAWYTFVLVTVDTWADTLGTAGHLYDRYSVYDKVTHFFGGMALTAVAANIFRELVWRQKIRWSFAMCLVWAVAASMLLNVGWETYEYLGDVLLHTGRHQGWLDTTYDFTSDLIGSLTVAVLIWRFESAAIEERSLAARAVTRRDTVRGAS